MKKIGNGSWGRTKVVHGDNIFAEEHWHWFLNHMVSFTIF